MYLLHFITSIFSYVIIDFLLLHLFHIILPLSHAMWGRHNVFINNGKAILANMRIDNDLKKTHALYLNALYSAISQYLPKLFHYIHQFSPIFYIKIVS